jgi:succinyl-CoA synthetase alpha subunit
MFQADPETEGIVMIGEIGGGIPQGLRNEETGRRFHRRSHRPPGRRMGHAGAVISGGNDTAAFKVDAMRAAGIRVAESPAALGEEMLKAMKG